MKKKLLPALCALLLVAAAAFAILWPVSFLFMFCHQVLNFVSEIK